MAHKAPKASSRKKNPKAPRKRLKALTLQEKLQQPLFVRRMAKLGLAMPDLANIYQELHNSGSNGSKAFGKLQKAWYSKLRQEGFEDIEWVDNSTGFGQDTPNLKHGVGNLVRSYKDATEFYYSMCRNFATHGQFDAEDKLIWDMYSEGVPYRQILKAYKFRFKRYKSLYFIFYRLRELTARMRLFNTTHKEGLLAPTALESGISFQSRNKPTSAN